MVVWLFITFGIYYGINIAVLISMINEDKKKNLILYYECPRCKFDGLTKDMKYCPNCGVGLCFK